VDTAKRLGLLDALPKLGRNIALQGELCGPGIQGDGENLAKHHFFLFDVFDIDQQRYLTPAERYTVFDELVSLGATFSHVPIVNSRTILRGTVAETLQMAEGKNAAGNEREGLVFKRLDGQFSFKAISNRFLLKGGD
jgi:ATP-dependent RNA circularization protein (DNA/RNA ligase family)